MQTDCSWRCTITHIRNTRCSHCVLSWLCYVLRPCALMHPRMSMVYEPRFHINFIVHMRAPMPPPPGGCSAHLRTWWVRE